MHSETPKSEWMLRLVVCPVSGGLHTLEQADNNLSGFHQTLTFSRSRLLQSLLVPELYNALSPLIDAMASKETTVYESTDFVVTGPGFSVGGLRIRKSASNDEPQRIFVEFTFALGRMQDILRMPDQIGRQVLSHRERIAVSALADIASPLLSLASIPKSSFETPDTAEFLTERLGQISNRAEELQFQLSMLMRYVRDCAETGTRSQVRVPAPRLPLQISDHSAQKRTA